MNLSTLTSTLKDWTERQSLSQATINMSTTLVEADLNKRLRHERMIVRATPGIPETEETWTVLNLPDNAVEVAQVVINDIPLTRRGRHERNRLPTSGEPKYWISRGDVLELWPPVTVGPEHDKNLPELDYYSVLDPVTENDLTNWVLCYFSDVYFFGCLYYLGLYLKDHDMETRNKRHYDEAVLMLNLQGNRQNQSTGMRIST